MKVLTVNQGEFKVSLDQDVTLATVLGSCVAVCVRNTRTGVAGMNHFLLPRAAAGQTFRSNTSLIYGTYSIERLINEVIEPRLGRAHLEVKVFGGARMLGENLNVGEINANFVEDYFAKEGIAIAASDLRGTWARKVSYHPSTGKARVAKLTRVPVGELLETERKAQVALHSNMPFGGLELLR